MNEISDEPLKVCESAIVRKQSAWFKSLCTKRGKDFSAAEKSLRTKCKCKFRRHRQQNLFSLYLTYFFAFALVFAAADPVSVLFISTSICLLVGWFERGVALQTRFTLE